MSAGGGSKPLYPERNQRVIAMLEEGASQRDVAASFGITKNAVSGIWARAGRGDPQVPARTTMLERLDAMHAKMDAVLAETRGLGRVPVGDYRRQR